MKAPGLFGYIAVILLILTLIVFSLIIWTATRLGAARSNLQST
jgi:hypothetical protein